MIRFIFWRLVQSVAVLWAVYTVTFFLLMITPGDPFSGEKNAPQAVKEALATRYHLDYLVKEHGTLSAPEKLWYCSNAYFYYLGAACRGDLGPSLTFDSFSVRDIIAESLPVSLALGSLSLLIALWLGVVLGMWGAVRKNRPADLSVSIISLLGVSLPSFVVGVLLLMGFAVALPVFPAGRWGGGWSGLGRVVLPAISLALFFVAYISRLSRSATLDVLHSDFVRTARAKGQRPGRVLTLHVGANAALPILSYLGPAAANVLVGSFVIEKLFSIPGLGTHFVNGCLNKDIPLVLGAVLVYSAMVVLFNLLVDIAYATVDPRIALH
ncbi:MAG TPA: ABC transporter permease [Phycisphaerae bacterium]|jgi:oligopeptide transport system permease protein|nr:ABC transporter permease [Phycisphaerae bacterium]